MMVKTGYDEFMNRQGILETAKEIVTKDRQATHGRPEDTFAVIAGLWSAYLGVELTVADVAAMQALVKVGRLKGNPTHADNWIDLAGYAACGGELATQRAQRVALGLEDSK